ncbi:MAG: oxidoreductase [Pseudomonadota bacterium]
MACGPRETHLISRVWIITGASSGLGAALVETALSAGDSVVACVRKRGDAERVEALGAEPKILDVTTKGDVERVVSEVIADHGKIDIAVSNAGYGLIGPIEEVSEAEARAQFDVNFFGALWFLQAILPSMRARRSGHIITITSVSGLAPWAGTGLYTASKYALEGLCQTLHDEVAEFGIDVTNVAPGGLRTNFAKGSMAMPQRRISDYTGAARVPQEMYPKSAGNEAGDPVKAAAAIAGIAGAQNPPLHLLLGDDALGYWRGKQAQMAEEVAAYETLSRSIAIDGD